MNNTFSKKITDNEIKLILKYMKSHLYDNSNSSIQYFFRTKNYTITIYKNNTLLIQGKSYENILKLLNVKLENQILDIKKYNVGSDESGNGNFFGGVAVCACYINSEIEEKISSFKITDSKLLNDKEISKIAINIKDIVPHSIKYISPKEYNELFDKYKNINVIKTILHTNAINDLKYNNKVAVIDQYTTNNKFKEHLDIANISINCEYHLETKAESKYIAVAAASILARHKFINELDKISNEINIKLPLGSVDSKILPILEKIKNKIVLKNVCKTHFKTINKIN